MLELFRHLQLCIFYDELSLFALRISRGCVASLCWATAWRIILEFKMCLRDKAVGWFEGLAEDGVDTADWQVVKAEFLESYEPKYSAKTTCANFMDLNQKSDETINDYTYRIQMTYKRLTDNKP